MATQTAQPMEFIDRHAKHYRLVADSILYVEADNIYSRIICEKQTIHVCHPIFLMEELLPNYFLRIHRSFLVNSHTIIALYRHMVILNNGMRLPVPDKKYLWLKESLENLNQIH